MPSSLSPRRSAITAPTRHHLPSSSKRQSPCAHSLRFFMKSLVDIYSRSFKYLRRTSDESDYRQRLHHPAWGGYVVVPGNPRRPVTPLCFSWIANILNSRYAAVEQCRMVNKAVELVWKQINLRSRNLSMIFSLFRFLPCFASRS